MRRPGKNIAGCKDGRKVAWHTPSNITAGVGGSWDELPKGLADIFIEAPYNHADFDALIRFSSIRQPSPQNLLNQ